MHLHNRATVGTISFKYLTLSVDVFFSLDPSDSMPEGFVPTSYIEIYDKFAQPQPV